MGSNKEESDFLFSLLLTNFTHCIKSTPYQINREGRPRPAPIVLRSSLEVTLLIGDTGNWVLPDLEKKGSFLTTTKPEWPVLWV